MLLYLVLAFEVLSFMFSLLLYLKSEIPLYLKFFPGFLLITVIVEVIGYQIKHLGTVGIPMYNYFTAFEFIVYLFVLYYVISNKKIKKAIIYSNILSLIVATIDILLRDKYTFHSPSYTLGAILVVCYCMYYFYELFKNPVFKNYLQEPTFWICLGLLFYYSCTLPLITFYNYINTYLEVDAWTHALILSITNVFLYTCFAVAFFSFYKFKTSKKMD